MGRIRQHVIVVLALCITAACGGGSSSPTTPTPAPQIVQVAGLWGYTATLTGSSLEALVTSDSTGTSTRYAGTAGSSSVALTAVAADVGSVTGIECPSGGGLVDLITLPDAINGTVSGSTITGTQAETSNVTVTGTGAAAGILTLNSSFVATEGNLGLSRVPRDNSGPQPRGDLRHHSMKERADNRTESRKDEDRQQQLLPPRP